VLLVPPLPVPADSEWGDMPIGMRFPELRHKALAVLMKRNYLSPSACHYLMEDSP